MKITILFDYKICFLILENAYVVFPATFILKKSKFCKISVFELAYVLIHSTKNLFEPAAVTKLQNLIKIRVAGLF